MFDSVFMVALQSSLLLGLIHGVNPCGHSWLVIAPFVVGRSSGSKVLFLTSAFLLGTALGCLVIGLTLGGLSSFFTPAMSVWVDVLSNGVIILLGFILLLRPLWLHHHDHDGHEHEEHHAHGDASGIGRKFNLDVNRATGAGLFLLGFVNMIVPCPTAAIMYGYALKSGSASSSTLIFGAYALSTAIAVGAVIFALHRAVSFVRALEHPGLEALLMRSVGVLTVLFGVYSLWIEMGVS
jgi:nickel/cobalt transporter (NicO) family protein